MYTVGVLKISYFIVCSGRTEFIHSPTYLETHIRTFLSHIAAAFNLLHDQMFHLQGADVMQLPNSTPYIDLHLQCPQCKMWLCQSDKRGWKSGTLRLHLTYNSKCTQLL